MSKNIISISFKEGHLPATIIEVLREPGEVIKPEDKILKYQYEKTIKAFGADLGSTNNYKKIKIDEYMEARNEGVIEEFLVKTGDTIKDKRQKILTLRVKCAHALSFMGLCADCGEVLPIDPDSSALDDFIPVSHISSDLMISKEKARDDSSELTKRLLSEKKLLLILDLDQTLIQANTSPIIGEYMENSDNVNYEAVRDIKSFKLAPPDPNTYYIKPRPGLDDFLEKLHTKYEMHVYTMGTRQYAEEVCKAIDPTKKYFYDRIISRDESGSDRKKDIKRLFPIDDAMVVIVDDRYDVWDWVPNLIRIWPYDFFGNGDINGAQFQNNSQAPPDEKIPIIIEPESDKDNTDTQKPVLVDNDDHLQYTLDLALKVHAKFYKEFEQSLGGTPFSLQSSLSDFIMPNVSEILPNLRKRVFKGCRIVFSGIFPQGYSQLKDELVSLIKFYGAEHHERVSRRVTHLVTNNTTTDKAKKAKKLASIFILRLDWIYESVKKCCKEDEEPYCLEGLPNYSPSAHNNVAPYDPEMYSRTPPNSDILKDLEPMRDGGGTESYDSDSYDERLNYENGSEYIEEDPSPIPTDYDETLDLAKITALEGEDAELIANLSSGSSYDEEGGKEKEEEEEESYSEGVKPAKRSVTSRSSSPKTKSKRTKNSLDQGEDIDRIDADVKNWLTEEAGENHHSYESDPELALPPDILRMLEGEEDLPSSDIEPEDDVLLPNGNADQISKAVQNSEKDESQNQSTVDFKSEALENESEKSEIGDDDLRDSEGL